MDSTRFFEITEKYGWGTKTTDHRVVKKGLLAELTREEGKELNEAYSKLVSKLHKALDEVVTGVGDDSYGDLCAHIVGLGKAEYEATLKNPERAAERARKGDYKESFAYCLPYDDDFEKKGNPKAFESWAKDNVEMYEAVLSDKNLTAVHKDAETIVAAMKLLIEGNVEEFKKTEFAGRAAAKAVAKAIEAELERVRRYSGGFVVMDGCSAGNEWGVLNLYSDVREYL